MFNFVADLADAVFPLVVCAGGIFGLNYVEELVIVDFFIDNDKVHEVCIEEGALTKSIAFAFLCHFLKGVTHNCDHHVQEDDVRDEGSDQKEQKEQV